MSSTAFTGQSYAYSTQNTNTMDADAMPSEQAQAARNKTDEVMQALRSGEPGAADKAMGDSHQTGKSKGWLSSKMEKLRGGKSAGEDEKVVR